ncbi:hypothetical protein GmHk_10G028470 [Glycine max]|nr:hypothetical protein GmHk_10G028470 [Glycine max]
MANNEAESEVTISDSKNGDNYDKLLDAFNEMHQEAQKLAISNYLLKGKLRWHVDKLVEIQKELLEEKAKDGILEKEKNNSSCNCTKTTNVTSPCEGYNVLEVKKIENNNNNNSHVSNVVRKVISNLNVISTLENKLKNSKQKKAYIAWEDNASTSSDSSSDEEVANVCLMAKSMDDSSTFEETKVNPKLEELLEAFKEMHEEVQRLVVFNKMLKSNLKLYITKLASTQSELDKLKQENEKLFSSY